jgi:flagella basal body P-ring formation protein FlgA
MDTHLALARAAGRLLLAPLHFLRHSAAARRQAVAAAVALAAVAGGGVASVRAQGLADGQPATAAVPATALAQALRIASEAAQAAAPAGARVEVEPGTPDARLRLAPCQRVTAMTTPGAPAWGRTRVGLKCTEGPQAWHIQWPMTVRVLAPAWVTTTALPAGTALDSAHLSLATVDWAAAAGTPFTEAEAAALRGRTLLRALPAGQAPRSADLQQRRWFVAGQPVRVLVQGSGFAISAQGQALSDGLEGRPARVRTETGRVLTGMPVGEARMQVTL